MKYIEKVILENFQSHKNSIIEFDNQLNVIVGPSDSGKTAILRGIKWALYNEPSGDYFIKEGESECSVIVIFSDGTKIKRYRSKSKNIYYLYDLDNNEIKFEGFGTTVPEEITNITGIKKILLDNDESRSINLSDQLDGAFLLSERGALRANSIGRLVGVNVIDDSLRDTLRDVRKLSSDKKYIENKVVELEEELKEYEYLEEFENKINKIEKIKNIIDEKYKLQTKYKDIFGRISNISKEQERILIYIERLKDIDKLDLMIKDTSLNINKYNYLYNQKHKLLNLFKDKKVNIHIMESLKNINIVEENIAKITLKSDNEIKCRKIKLNLDNNLIETSKCKEVINKSKELEQLQVLINNISDKAARLHEIKRIYSAATELKRSLAIGEEYLKKLEHTEEIYRIQTNIDEKNNLFNKLQEISMKYISNTKDIEDTNKNLIKLEQSFEENLNKYKELLLNQETCPLCFSNIDNDKIKHIISHYN